MAKLIDYDDKSIEHHSDNQVVLDAIMCMEGVISFPINETSNAGNCFEISGFEKSFWGKTKLKASCKISIIDDLKLVITVPVGTDDIPPYYDVAIGFEFFSNYNSYSSDNGYFILGKTRKIILSYYWLMALIDIKYGLYKERDVDVMSTMFETGGMISGMKDLGTKINLMIIKSKIESLKYKATIYES